MNTFFYRFFLICVLAFLSCSNGTKSNSNGIARIEFSQTDFNFGRIKQGEMVAHRFIFKNTGDGDLMIKNVVPGCGCTVASFPKEPIAPGKESYIEATFNSEGYRGMVLKEVQVFSNSEQARQLLTISAEVLTEDQIIE